ncbi:MAG TPA: ABC transporter permease [Vicinamibacterales bacterium]|jgi:putative ABC transport system permease protein
MDTLIKDLIYAARTLRKRPGFTAVAVATLALGIGASTAIFSVVDAVLLRPLPYADGGRLALLWGELRTRNVLDFPFSPPDFRELKQHVAAFEDVAAVTPAGRVPIGGDGGQPEQVRSAGATTNVFTMLGARIIAGRDFIASDGEAPPPPPAGAAPPPPIPLSAILSYEFWQRRYGGDMSVVGKTIDFGGGNGRAHIVGVLAPGFEILYPPRANMIARPDLWIALRVNFDTAIRNNVFMRPIGRLRPGATVQEAQGQAEALAADWRQRYPIAKTADHHVRVVAMRDDLVGDVRPAILALLGAVLFVLLIACANVANLLVVRAAARGREIAVRAAIGGTRWRIVRQLLAETLLLAGMGTVFGLGLAYAGIRLLLSIGPEDLPRLGEVAIDPRVLAFATLAGLVTAVACGTLPALRASRPNLMDVLRQSGGTSGLRAGRLIRNVVVVTEVALSFVLLVGSGLMIRSFIAVQRVDPGFEPKGVLTFLLPARGQRPPDRVQFLRQVRERLHGLPGVAAVSAGTSLPLDGSVANGRIGPEQALSDQSLYRQANANAVLPEYFETLRTRLVAGRTFTEADNAGGQKLIILDEKIASRLFPRESAIGKRVASRVTTPEAELFEVIGVVAHQRHETMAADGFDGMFFTDGYFGGGAAARWAVRTTGDPAQLAGPVRAAIAELDPKATLAEVQPMSTFVDKATAPMRFSVLLIGIFAGIAVVMAAVGLYGVLSTVVRQRTAELGMRMILGAPSARIFSLVVGEGLRLSAVGVAVGLVVAFGVTRLMTRLLVGVTPSDPATFAAITVLFFAIATLASWLPARRAAGLTPSDAIREE